jgi:adhesin transport system outer membrane protein
MEKSALHTRSAAQNHLLDLQRTVDEAVRNAWVQLLNSRARAEMFRSQAETRASTGEGQEGARDRGETSLTDLLLAENNWINAQIGVTTAEFDQSNAAFDLFFAMGRLELNLFTN